MTIKFPKLTILDKFLRMLGKRRAVFIIDHKQNRFGRYSSYHAIKENFLKSLFRSKNTDLPDRFVDIFELINRCEDQ